jgi:imidazolonepropionase-like amidohydrolase
MPMPQCLSGLRPALVALALAFAADACPASAEAPNASPRVYQHATLIDGLGENARTGMTIVIAGDRIRAVTPDAAYAPLPGAEVVDAAGLTVLPGLIDTHQHLATQPMRRFAEAMLRRQIYSGITAVRDMAGDARFLAEIQRETLLGEIPGPDVYFAALMAGPSFFIDPRTHASAQGAVAGQTAWMQAIDANTDMTIAVARARGTGATAIKIYANLPSETVHRIVAEAHRQGFRVWAHAAVFPALPADVADAGVDVLSHACLLAYQINPTRPDDYHQRAPIDPTAFAAGDNPQLIALLQTLHSRGEILDATIRVYAKAEEEAAKDKTASASARRCDGALAAKITNLAWRQGVTISAGTDGETDWRDPYPALDEEIELLAAKAGLNPMAALKAATINAARAAGKEKDMGTVEPGKLANLVFLHRNPLDDLANLRTVAFTVKRGRIYRREDFKPLTAEETAEPGLN